MFLGRLQQLKDYVAIGCFHSDSENHLDFDLAHSIMEDYFYWAVPKGRLLPQWKSFFDTFDSLVLIVTLIILTFFLWFFKKSSFFECYLFFHQVLLEVSIHKISQEPSKPARIIIGTSTLCFCIISTSFKITLINILSTLNYEKDLENLHEMIEAKLSFNVFPFMNELYQFSNDSDEIFVNENKEICFDNYACLNLTANRRRSATLLLGRFYQNVLPGFFDIYGNPQLVLVKKEIKPIHIHIFFSKGFPLYEPINDVILRLRDAGIVSRLYEETKRKADERLRQKTEVFIKILDFDRLTFAFVPWFLGLCISCGVFLLEIIVHKVFKR